MNIIIDASWIADQKFDLKVKGGAIRVLLELLNGLGQYPNHNFYLTNSSYLPEDEIKLKKFQKEFLDYPNIKVSAVKFGFLRNIFLRKIFYKISLYIPINYYIPFVPKSVLEIMDVYHSCNDALPRFIRINKSVKKFYTALDLIPILRPDYSNQFFEYTKNIYSSLPVDSKILAISQSTKKDILTFRPDIKENQIRVIYLGASKSTFYYNNDIEYLNKELSRFHLEYKKYFLTLNAVAKYKNFETVLEGYLEFKRTSNFNFSMVIVGSNRESEYKNYLSTKYGSDLNLIFLENIEDSDLNILYNGSKSFFYLSKYEGFGLPVLEAMQCGSPVICSNVTSLPEIAGNAALQCAPEDINSFVENIKLICNNPELEEKMVHSGLHHSKIFSWDKYRLEVIKAYEEF